VKDQPASWLGRGGQRHLRRGACGRFAGSVRYDGNWPKQRIECRIRRIGRAAARAVWLRFGLHGCPM